MTVDYLAEPVVDYLKDVRIDGLDDAFCDLPTGGCGHALTNHSRGMVIHDRCLILGCDCKKAVLTGKAQKSVKNGLLP